MLNILVGNVKFCRISVSYSHAILLVPRQLFHANGFWTPHYQVSGYIKCYRDNFSSMEFASEIQTFLYTFDLRLNVQTYRGVFRNIWDPRTLSRTINSHGFIFSQHPLYMLLVLVNLGHECRCQKNKRFLVLPCYNLSASLLKYWKVAPK